MPSPLQLARWTRSRRGPSRLVPPEGTGRGCAEATRTVTVWSDLEATKAQKATKKIELDKDLQVAESALRIAQWRACPFPAPS